MDKLARFCLLPQGDDPIMWDFGSAARHHEIYCPWLEGRSPAGISTMRGAMSPESGRAEDVAAKIRRSLEESPEVKYYVSNGDAETPLSVLALAACTRHQVEDFFEDAKGYLGLSQYETRSWVGWHHHMTLVGLAHLFVSVTRLRLKKKFRA